MLHQLIGVLSLLEAYGLRVDDRWSPETIEAFEPLPDKKEKARALPPLDVLKELWEEKTKLEDPQASLPESVQVILGLFAAQSGLSDEVKDINRKTWMNRKGVCWLQNGPRKGCTVYPTYVLGERTPLVYREDELVLNITENMCKGKTFSYFHHAAKLYPWATHIAKMDLDAFPFVHRLTWSLANRAKPNCHLYVGRILDFSGCGKAGWCPPEPCGHPVEGNFLDYAQENKTVDCWSYMQGGMYVLSSKLARIAAVEDDYWSNHSSGWEDLVTGKMVSRIGKMKHLCIDHFDPLAWDHATRKVAWAHSVADKWKKGL